MTAVRKEVTVMADQEIQASEKRELTPEKGELTHEGLYFTPAVDIYETEKELVLLADMPGVDVDGLDIDLEDNTLSIIGKIGAEEPEGEGLLTEYRLGNYFRNFSLTDVVDQSRISATLSDGVLKLTLPKAEKTVPRKIPITEG
jgi:HSP20 family protein